MSSKMSGIKFDTAIQRLWERHLVELNRYFCCPKDYPKYCQEWLTFVEKRTTNIFSIGGDVMNYDYHTEFEEKWKTTIPEIMKEIWKKKKRCLSHLLKSKHKYHSLEEIMLKVEHRVKHNIRDSSSSSSSSSSPHHSRDNKKDKSEKKPKRRFSWFSSSSSSSSSSSDTSSDHSRSPERRRRRRRSGNSKRCSSRCRKRRSHTSSCSCRRDHKPGRRRKSSSSEDSFRSRSLSHKRRKSKTFSRSRSRTGSRTRSRSKSSISREKYHSRSRSKSSNNYGKKFASTDVSKFGFSSRKSSSSNSLSRKRSNSRSRSRSISKDSISKRSRSRTGSRRPRSRTGSRRPRSRTGSRRPRSKSRSGSASKSDRSRSRSMSLSVIPKSRTAVKSRSRSDSRSRTTPKVSRSRSVSGTNSNIKNDQIESRTDSEDRDEGDINTQELIKPCANCDPNKGSDSNSGNKAEIEGTEESPIGENLPLDKLSLEKSGNTGTFQLSLDEIVKTVGSPKTNVPGESTIPLTSREISDDDIKHCLLDTIYLLTSYRDKLGSFYIIFDDILSKLQDIVLSEKDKDISTLLTLDFILAMRLFQDKLRVIGFSNRIKDEKSLDIVHKIEDMIKFIFPTEEFLPVTLYGLSMNDTAITIRNKSEKDAKLFIKFLLNYDGLIGITSKEIDEVYVTSLKHLEKEFT